MKACCILMIRQWNFLQQSISDSFAIFDNSFYMHVYNTVSMAMLFLIIFVISDNSLYLCWLLLLDRHVGRILEVSFIIFYQVLLNFLDIMRYPQLSAMVAPHDNLWKPWCGDITITCLATTCLPCLAVIVSHNFLHVRELEYHRFCWGKDVEPFSFNDGQIL